MSSASFSTSVSAASINSINGLVFSIKNFGDICPCTLPYKPRYRLLHGLVPLWMHSLCLNSRGRQTAKAEAILHPVALTHCGRQDYQITGLHFFRGVFCDLILFIIRGFLYYVGISRFLPKFHPVLLDIP